MTRHLHIDLPQYAQTPIGRALIAEVLAARPESRPIRDDWGTRDYPRYSGKPAALLRKLRREWVEREYALLDSQYAVTHIWSDDDARAILGCEQSDALIQRLIAETAEQKVAA